MSRSKCSIPTERSYQKEYSYEYETLARTVEKISNKIKVINV